MGSDTHGGEWQYGEVMAFIIIGTLVLLTSLLILLIFLNVLLTKKYKEIERRLTEKTTGESDTKDTKTDQPCPSGSDKRHKSESSESDLADTPSPTAPKQENPTGMLLAEVKVDIEKMMISNNIELTQQTPSGDTENQNKNAPKKLRSPSKKKAKEEIKPLTANQICETINLSTSSSSNDESESNGGANGKLKAKNPVQQPKQNDYSSYYGTFSDRSPTPTDFPSGTSSRSVRFFESDVCEEPGELSSPSFSLNGQPQANKGLQATKATDLQQPIQNVQMRRQVDYF